MTDAELRRRRLITWIEGREEHHGLTARQIVDVSGLYDGHEQDDRCFDDLKVLHEPLGRLTRHGRPARWWPTARPEAHAEKAEEERDVARQALAETLDKLPFGRSMERAERQRDLALDCAEKAEAERDELREAGDKLAEALRVMRGPRAWLARWDALRKDSADG